MAREILELFRFIHDICEFMENSNQELSDISKETTLKLVEPLGDKGLDDELGMVLQLQDIISQQLSINVAIATLLKEKLENLNIRNLHDANSDIHQRFMELQKRRDDFFGKFAGDCEELEFF